MEIRIEVLQFAQSFNIKKFHADFLTVLHSGLTSEVFYTMEDTDRNLYVFDYGVVVFANYHQVAQSELISL